MNHILMRLRCYLHRFTTGRFSLATANMRTVIRPLLQDGPGVPVAVHSRSSVVAAQDAVSFAAVWEHCSDAAAEYIA